MARPGAGCGGAPASVTATGQDGIALFRKVYEKALETYVDAPDEAKVMEGAINGMLASLDPHSNYLDPKALSEFQVTMKGEEFGGLGLEVMQDGGLVRVVSPIDDTPAARAGMMSGDLIARSTIRRCKGLSLKEAVDKMRGPAKTSVRLTVSRGEAKDTKEFTIVREIIHVQPVRSHLESGDIGYIRITQFNQQTFDALKVAIAKFKTNPGPTS